MSQLAPIIAGGALALFSGWLLRHALQGSRHAEASRSWPTVEGRVTKAALWGRRNVDGEMREVEKLSLEYAYSVGGEEYRGTSPTFYTLVYPETVEFAERFPEGSTVAVHYDQAEPSRSVLVPGPRPGHKRHSDLVLGGIGLAASLVLIALGATGKLG